MPLRAASPRPLLALALLMAPPLAGQDLVTKPLQAAKGQLTLSRLKPPRPQTTLVPGINARGELDSRDPVLPGDKTPYEVWWYAGRAGEVLLVTMRAAQADAYLIVLRQGPKGLETIAEDDDGLGAGTTDAGLRTTLPADGDYLIVANAAAVLGPKYFYGKYVLEVASSLGNSLEPDWATLYPGGGSPNDRFAVVVGVADYPGEDHDLIGPRQDAAIFRQVLIERYGFKPENIVSLTDQNGSRDQIINAFQRFLSQAGPGGTAVFYFSGSGTQLDTNVALTGADDPDGRDDGIVVWGNGGAEKHSLIAAEELEVLGDELSAGRVLLVLDACYSGTGSRAPRGLPKFIRYKEIKATTELPRTWITGSGARSTLPSSHILLTAASEKEVAWVGTGWPTRGGLASVFTYFLVEAMDRAPPGTTVDQLMQTVGPETNEFAKANFARTQTPQEQGARVGESLAEYLGQR